MTATYGEYGGRYVPETLIPALDELTAGWEEAQADPAFKAELDRLGRDYAGLDDALLVAVTEKRTQAQIDRLVEVLSEVAGP